MKTLTKRGKVLLGAGTLALIAALSVGTTQLAVGSDHADTIESVQKPGIDLTDLHIFPSPENSDNVVLALSVRSSALPGDFSRGFDNDVLYQFKIDTDGDANVTEDLVIQARFEGTGANQRVFIAGPVKPTRTGLVTQFETPYATTGVYNQTFSPTSGMRVFAGARADSFFLDLDQLGVILPDRLANLDPSKRKDTIREANTPQATTWASGWTGARLFRQYQRFGYRRRIAQSPSGWRPNPRLGDRKHPQLALIANFP